MNKRTLIFSLFNQKQKVGQSLTEESASFLWHQMLIYVLKQMPKDEQAKDEMLKICNEYYSNNDRTVEKIEEFRLNYTSDTAIQWYTAECFLYKILNQALRIENIELLYKFRFFIIDLCDAIEKESNLLKNESPLILYRGQVLSNNEFNRLKQHEGEIISINGFFSTSRNIHVALAFAGQNHSSDDNIKSILFEIQADPSLATVIFADIKNKTHFQDEEEILFNLNSTFQIKSVYFDLILKLWKVELITIDECSKIIEEYKLIIKDRLNEYSPFVYFGRILLFELCQINQAKIYFEMLLESRTFDYIAIASIYNHFGHIYRYKSQLNLALKYFQLAYDIRRKYLPLYHPDIAASVNNIAGIYNRMGYFNRALDYYQQTLFIDEVNYLGDHYNKVVNFKGIGRIYANQKNFNQAFLYMFSALNMSKRILPTHHSYIGDCIQCIGYAYEMKGDFIQALDYYHQQLNIIDKCYPSNHRKCFINLLTIVNVYKKMNNIELALKFSLERLDKQKIQSNDTQIFIGYLLILISDLLELENPNEVFKYYTKVISILKQIISSDYQEIYNYLEGVGVGQTDDG
ncbi:hypothetical protein I4U23_022942 [Adineta vaga]|nr:hypothetical protein I4U23_022942 [Adineta vaga]